MTIQEILKSDLPINHKVRSIRKAKGMTQVDLAEKSGTSRRMIQNIENGSQVPSVFTLELILEVLGCKLEVKKKSKLR